MWAWYLLGWSCQWDRLRISPDIDLAFCVRGRLENRRADLAKLLVAEARHLLLAVEFE